MRSRASFLIALCALLICLSGQVAEVFDQWDHTVQTGSDTEYTFVVVALCVGVSYSLRWFSPEISAPGVAASASAFFAVDSFLNRATHRALSTLTTASPPSIALRI
jgi:hypothetical protein